MSKQHSQPTKKTKTQQQQRRRRKRQRRQPVNNWHKQYFHSIYNAKNEGKDRHNKKVVLSATRTQVLLRFRFAANMFALEKRERARAERALCGVTKQIVLIHVRDST